MNKTSKRSHANLRAKARSILGHASVFVLPKEIEREHHVAIHTNTDSTARKREPVMHHHKAAQKTSPSKSEKVPLVRAVVLHQDDKLSTVGFPALHQAETKRVTFARPLHAKCMSIDGVWSTDCLVLSVWDTGAQLRVRRPGDLTEFYLLFTSSFRPVFRQCRRVSAWGNVIQVEYQPKQPDSL